MLYSFGTADVSLALFRAIEAEDSKSLKYLLEHGAAVNVKDHKGCYPIDNAIWKCNKDMVEVLVTNGADVQSKDSECYDKYLSGASSCHEPLEIMKILVNKSQDLGAAQSALCYAAFRGDTKTADFFITNGAKVNKPCDDKSTPLHWAVVGDKSLEVINLLVSYGADMNAKDPEGKTPLITALFYGYRPSVEVVKSLVEHGADVNFKASDGRTPLLYASYRVNRSELIKYLVKTGADVNSQNHRGESTLSSVVKSYNYGDDSDAELISFLLEHGADIDAKDSEGMSPLFWAGNFERKEIVRIFVNYDLAKTDNYQSFGSDDVKKEELIDFLCESASLHYRYGGELLRSAATSQNLERIKFLIYHGADIQFKNNYFQNNTALHVIVAHTWYIKYLRGREDNPIDPKDISLELREEYSNTIELIKFLLGHGIDSNSRNDEGKTAAEYSEIDEVSEILYYYTEQYNLHPFCNFSDCQKVCPVY